MKKSRWKLFTYMPFLAAILVIGLIQTFMLANENVKPYPEPFGRATELPQLATYWEPVQMVGERSFTYLAGTALAYVTIDDEGQNVSESRSLSDTGSFRSHVMLDKDHVVWIGDGDKLYASEWKSGSWSPKSLLLEKAMNAVQVVAGSNGERILLAYDDVSLYVSTFHPNEKLNWSQVSIANMKHIQGYLDASGSLSLVYAVNKEGNESFHYAKLAWDSWKPLLQYKLKDLDVAGTSLDDMSLAIDGSNFLTVYTTSSRKSGKSTLHMITFPSDQPDQAQDEILTIPVSKTTDSDTILHPTFTHSTSGDVSLVVSSVYEKNRRQTSQEVYKIAFKNGKMQDATRISQFSGFAVYPSLAAMQDRSLSIWLDAVNAESFRVFYATDQTAYQSNMNHIRGKDYQQAAGNLPLFWGIGILTALISLKSILLPGLYLIVLSVFWQYHYEEHAKRHFGISLVMYLVVKILFIGDYRKTIALQVMPDFLQSIWMNVLLLLIFAALSYLCTRLWRKRLGDRNVGLEMFVFVAFDVIMTNMWYSFFMSPANL